MSNKTIWCLMFSSLEDNCSCNEIIAWFDKYPNKYNLLKVVFFNDQEIEKITSTNRLHIPQHGEFRLQEIKEGERIEYGFGRIEK
jgi:hypothetical protein